LETLLNLALRLI